MLNDTIECYLRLRRALGVSYEKTETRLCSFARFAEQSGDTHVRSETAIAWASSSSSPLERDYRLRAVARFARHAHSLDESHEVPPEAHFAHRYLRPTPYIFLRQDIPRLVAAAQLLPPAGSPRPLTFGALFALLAATGLRISEALALRFADLTVDGLVIRQTKFHKSRLVPLHETAVCGLERYLHHRRGFDTEDDHVFVGMRGKRLAAACARSVFHKLVDQLGLDRGPDQPTPQLHSLRHTFAVRVLESSPYERGQVDRFLLALSTYLGHSSVANTYWYLEATPQLLRDISRACEAFRQEAVQ